MVLLWLIDMLLHLHLYSGGHHNLYRCKTFNIYLKCCSKCKSRDSFKICLSWGFQNTPYMFTLIEFWLRYLRSKTNDMILKRENIVKTWQQQQQFSLALYSVYIEMSLTIMTSMKYKWVNLQDSILKKWNYSLLAPLRKNLCGFQV